jgi:hypothetical protein
MAKLDSVGQIEDHSVSSALVRDCSDWGYL